MEFLKIKLQDCLTAPVNTYQKHWRGKVFEGRKKKAPFYKPDQVIRKLKKDCGWLYRKSLGKDLVLDDEKYFTLTESTQPGNESFYSSDVSKTPDNIKIRQKAKFEPKVMLYVAISSKGISEPIVLESGIAVKQEVYIQSCLNRSTIPFINKNYSNGEYLFWPDKASSHYEKKSIISLKKI